MYYKWYDPNKSYRWMTRKPLFQNPSESYSILYDSYQVVYLDMDALFNARSQVFFVLIYLFFCRNMSVFEFFVWDTCGIAHLPDRVPITFTPNELSK